MTAYSTNIVNFPARTTKPQTGFGYFVRMLAVRRTRKQLALVDDHILEDIGISRDSADQEASRPVWDVPVHWNGRG